jgi:membrane dipeptidase
MKEPMRKLVRWVVCLTALGPGSSGATPTAAKGSLPVVDLHVDLSYQVNYRGKKAARGTGQWLTSELGRAGVAGVVLPLFVPYEVSPRGPRFSDLEASYAGLLKILRATEPYALPGCAAQPGQVLTWLALEGAGPFALHAEEVSRWVSRGVRLWGLVHSRDNELATSSGTGPRWPHPRHGLTERGRELVGAIHRARAVVDVSHASDLAVRDILELARAHHVPVVATHSNARRLAHHPRNLTDEQIRAIAELGGVVGVSFHAPFLAAGRRAELEDVVRHVVHMIELVGAEHVAIGSDFEGGIQPPDGLGDVRGYPRLADALGRAGIGRADIRRILSENAFRILGCDSQVSPRAGQ